MAKPLSPEIVSLINTTPSDWTPVDIYTLTQAGLVEPNPGATGLQLSSKASRALKREGKTAKLEEVKHVVYQSLKKVAKDTNTLFRLDDVLKESGLPKAENRQYILDSLVAFREEGLLTTVKFSDNNFQIFWQATPVFFS